MEGRTVTTSVTLIFGDGKIEVFDDGCVVTLPDGSVIPGKPEDTDSYRATAAEHGYGDDTLKLCKDHEILHMAFALWLGMAESPTMRFVADGVDRDDEMLRGYEENAILAIQKYTHAMGIDLVELFRKNSR